MRTLVVNGLRLAGARTAMGRYIEAMAREWSHRDTPFTRIRVMAPTDGLLADIGVATPLEVHYFADRRTAVLWEQLSLPRRARGCSLLFCPAYTAPLAFGGPIVVANHGIYERLPDEFSRLHRLRASPLHRLSARRARRVIANSRQTKTDLEDFFGLASERIDVVYPAASAAFSENHDPAEVAAEGRRTLGGDWPYLIFVGKLARRRNVPNLIEAFAIVQRELDLPHRLLIVGPNTGAVPVAELATRSGLDGRVVYLPHLEQRPLALLYAGATAFVLPTTYEGISHTMFEAMASGTPVLTVDHPTLAEGAGDSALALPSPSVPDLVHGLRTLLSDESLREELSRRGRERAKAFSWARAAEETMEILDRVAAPADRRTL